MPSPTSQLDLFNWTPSAREDVRSACVRMFATSTASAVAARYGVTREAVLGYVHRARAAGQAVHVTRPTSARAMRRAARAAKVAVAPTRPSLPPVGVRAATVGTPMPTMRTEPVALIVVEVDDLPSLMSLSDRQCRAIVDDETGECCGLPTEGRSSWCRAHRAAYRAGTRPLIIRGL